MHRTKKGNRRHFRMKLHIGINPRVLVHRLEGTAANVATGAFGPASARRGGAGPD